MHRAPVGFATSRQQAPAHPTARAPTCTVQNDNAQTDQYYVHTTLNRAPRGRSPDVSYTVQ